MKRFARYAAATIAMTGMLSITAQASVGAIVIGGNCGNGGNYGNSNGVCDIGSSLSDFLSGGSGNGNGNFSLSDLFSWGKQGSWSCPDQGWMGSCPDIICPDTSQPEIDCPGITPPEIQPPKPDCPEIPAPKPPTLPEEPDIPEEPDKPAPGNPGGDGSGDTENRPPVADSPQAYIQEVADLVNQERAKAGLSPVTLSAQLSSAANIRSQEIMQSFSHTRPDGSSFSTAIRQSGISYQGSGENIAYGQSSPQAVMNAWMNSQGHRANILNPRYTYIGVGYAENSRGVPYWTQLFTY